MILKLVQIVFLQYFQYEIIHKLKLRSSTAFIADFCLFFLVLGTYELLVIKNISEIIVSSTKLLWLKYLTNSVKLLNWKRRDAGHIYMTCVEGRQGNAKGKINQKTFLFLDWFIVNETHCIFIFNHSFDELSFSKTLIVSLFKEGPELVSPLLRCVLICR